MFFYTCYGHEEFSSNGTSYINRLEADKIENIVTELLNNGANPLEIGIITPYAGQRYYLMSHLTNYGKLNKSLYEHIEIASVDAFQGREKILLYLVVLEVINFKVLVF